MQLCALSLVVLALMRQHSVTVKILLTSIDYRSALQVTYSDHFIIVCVATRSFQKSLKHVTNPTGKTIKLKKYNRELKSLVIGTDILNLICNFTSM